MLGKPNARGATGPGGSVYEECRITAEFLRDVLQRQLDIFQFIDFAPIEVQKMTLEQVGKATAIIAEDLLLLDAHQPVPTVGTTHCYFDWDEYPCETVNRLISRYSGSLGWQEIANAGGRAPRYIPLI